MLELNKIHCLDCLEELPKIEDNSIDCIITDPPYFIGFNSSAKEGGRQDYGNFTMLKPLFSILFKEFERILKPDGRVFMFTDWRTYPIVNICASEFMRVSNLIVWDYGWIKAGTQFRFTHEFIVHATMHKAKSPKDRAMSDVWRIKPINFTTKRNHPAEKPVEIIRRMLKECTEEGDLILDCFMGSGTTAIACKQLNRNFLGFEINQRYIDTYNSRLEQDNLTKFEMSNEQELLGNYKSKNSPDSNFNEFPSSSNNKKEQREKVNEE